MFALPLLILASVLPAGAEPPALSATLRDQHGRSDGFAAHRGRPLVVFVVTAPRLRRLRDWEQVLRQRHDDLPVLRVADVPHANPGEPEPRYEEVARVLRRRVPPEVPVLIDLERRWAADFDLDTREVNLLFFDAAGGWRGHVRGRPTLERRDEALAQLERLLGPRPGRAP
jgi:hypothetical protein